MNDVVSNQTSTIEEIVTARWRHELQNPRTKRIKKLRRNDIQRSVRQSIDLRRTHRLAVHNGCPRISELTVLVAGGRRSVRNIHQLNRYETTIHHLELLVDI